MNIPSIHPLVWLVSVALLAIAIGGTLIRSDDARPRGSRTTWSTNTTSVPRVYTTPSEGLRAPTQYGFEGESTLPTFSFASNDTARTALANSASDTLEELRAYLAERSTPKTTSSISLDLSNIYSFIPNGGSGYTTPSETAEQIELHAYGNAAGAAVVTLEATTRQYMERLPAFFSDPSSTNAQPLIAIANALSTAADTLGAIESVPASAADMHHTLITRYRATSLALTALASVRKSEDFSSGIEAYSTSVEELGNAFVALVIFFSEQKVTFGNTDPGAVFAFSGAL